MRGMQPRLGLWAVTVAAVLMGLGCQSRDTASATILYFNDGHELLPVTDELGERGGVARLKTVLDGLRRSSPGSVVVFGGDLAGGTLFGGLYRGRPMVEAFNRIGLDLASFGQHDFDFGAAHASELVRLSDFPWITSNLVDREGRPYAGLPTTATLSLGGLRVGFLGLTDAMETTTPDGAVFQRDLVDAAREAVSALEAEHVDAVVALTQARPEVNDRLMAELPRLDAILTEEESETRTVVRFVGARPIAAPCGNLGSVVRLSLVASGSGVAASVAVVPVGPDVPGDPALVALEQEYRERMERELGEVVAVSAAALDAGIPGDHGTRWRETALGDLIADAFREELGADIGLVNGGGIRAGLPAGPWRLRDLHAVLPFANRVVVVELTGAQLAQALEHGLSRVDELGGGFLQVSGLEYSFDRSRPVGARLVQIRVQGAPLRPELTYSAALPSHLAAGGDGFDVLLQGRVVVAPPEAPLDVDVLIAHVRELARQGPLQLSPPGRIEEVRRQSAGHLEAPGARLDRARCGQSVQASFSSMTTLTSSMYQPSLPMQSVQHS